MSNTPSTAPNTVKRETWATKIGFIFAAASWSIGLGNIWRFPYITGQYGGAAFLLVYLAVAFVMGIPLMIVEYNLGRESQSSPITGNIKLTKNKFWQLGGIFGFIGGLMIFSYYVMIIGWVAKYGIAFITGTFRGMNREAISLWFDSLYANTGLTLFYEIVILVLLGFIVSRGLVKGVEAVAKVAMPLMVFLFAGLAIYSNTLPGAFEGLKFYLKPDFTKLSFEAVVAAIGQVFLSIGVGQGASWVYGSYLKKDDDIPSDITKVVLMDTGFAFLAGLVIFPAAFAVGVQPDAGFGLLFKTMPSVFGTMPGGLIIGVLFFFGTLIAAITSAIAFTEFLSSSIMDLFKMDRSKDRVKATRLSIIVTFVLSLFSVLACGPLAHVKWFGMDMFTFFDVVSANIFLILSGLIMCLFTAWSIGFKKFKEQVNLGAKKLKVQDWWEPLIKYIVPIIIIINLIAANF
ncbi:MAG TPA: sodium-dependent transporter [Capillibacterium sp.]